ncbi:ATP-dependent RNA helicase TDRD9-like isoform X1 [Haliotis cracherodii]|uniref:ATP-dependent RNA helicase TDRD9-like isoform X1 n=2 Tax=Haliotis cracherodii TaxID=6455 RepID=UPI0039EA3996
MSRLTTEITLDDIDDWFKIGKESTKKKSTIQSVPRSFTGGRDFNPLTGTVHGVQENDFPNHLPPYKRNVSVDQHGYAEQFQDEEEQHLLKHYQPLEAGPMSPGGVAGRLEQLELDSTVAGSVGMPDDLVPPGAVEVYDNYQFAHTYDKKLPITYHKEQLLSTIESNQVTVIQGSTGSGKTTQVPQYILDHYAQEHKHCNIIITQPRRIAAVSVARRVCSERSWTLGSICGYQIGMDNKTSEDTRITYCTTGVLREKLIKTKNMLQFTHVILDEVHERDQESDFALLIVRKLLRTNSQHVKVILMSATIDCDLFASYFALPVRDRLEPAPVVSVEGRVFRVSEFYADDLTPTLGVLPEFDECKPELSEEIENMAVKLICEFDSLERKEQGLDKDTNFSPVRGTVLCFLPGYGEISDLYDKLRVHEAKHNLKVIPLHSTITQDEQMRVFEPALKGQRKVILSTNIAESSITVPDIKYVIDFCLTKNLVCDPMTNYTHLIVDWAAKSNCTQRKGRAGRVSNGRCYFMVTKTFFSQCLPDYGIPEMQRCPLETLVLKTKIFNMGEPRRLLGLALSPPRLDDIERTILNLKEVGALATSNNTVNSQYDGELTFIGRVLADLPVDIRIGKLLVLGHVFCLLEECLIIGAALSLKSIFARPFKAKLKAFEHKYSWGAFSLSDCIAILNAYKVWENNKKHHAFKRTGMTERKWGESHFIQIRRINETSDLIRELEQRLERFNIQKASRPPFFKGDYNSSKERLLLKLVLCGAFYPNYFLRGEVDEGDAIRVLSNHDPMNTVALKGLPANQGMLYKEKLQCIFSECSRDPPPIINFEETKAFIQFPWKGNTLCESRVHKGMYMAIKLRLLRIPIEVEMYTREDANIIASNLHKAQDMVASQGQLRTNRLKGSSQESLGQVVEPPRPSVSGVLIMVTAVVEFGHFWAQYYSDMAISQLKHVQDQLNSSTALMQVTGFLAPGSYCAAIYQDESVAFYRGKIVEIRGNMVQVFFVDYGNMEMVSRDHIRALPPQLLQIPFQAFECYLAHIRPSSLRCPDGVWSKESTAWFTNEYINKILYAQVFSVERSALRLEVIEKKLNNQQVVVNEEVVRKGYADNAEESFLSKQNHDERCSEAMSMTVSPDRAISGQKEEWMNVEMPRETRAALKGSQRMVKLIGPHSPLEMSFHSMTFVGRLRGSRIDQDSINSVAIDDEPQNTHARMMVAAFVGLNPQGSVMMARDTTIMPLIPGLPGLMCLLFAPVAELRTNAKRTHYTGAICGLGYEDKTNYPILPDHDIEVTFDTHINDEDIDLINCVRLAINVTVGKQDGGTWSGSAIERLQDNARNKLLRLVEQRREPIEPCNYDKAYHWNQIDPKYLMEPPSCRQDPDELVLLNPHYAIRLARPDETERISLLDEVRHSDYLKHHLQELKTLSIRHRSDTVTCELCDVLCKTPRTLSAHLQSDSHVAKENKLYGLYH